MASSSKQSNFQSQIGIQSKINTKRGQRTLEKVFQDCYERSKVPNGKLPARIVKELQFQTLFIANSETSQEEIPVICSFLKEPEALLQIETLVISSSSTVGTVHSRKCTHFKPGVVSALFLDNCHLFRSLIAFIAKCKRLSRLVIESVDINVQLVIKLSEALLATKSVIRWFGIKSCPLRDDGLNILATTLSMLHIQVLAFENCDLTDNSCEAIGRLLKAQMNGMDMAYWNATLRYGISNFRISSETVHVVSSGLIVMSLNGNRISGKGLYHLSKSLENNFWFLGISLANNLIMADELKEFLQTLSVNRALHAVKLGGNPGYTPELMSLAKEITNRNESRLNMLPSYVSKILSKWILAQRDDMLQASAMNISLDDDRMNLSIAADNVDEKEQPQLPPMISLEDFDTGDDLMQFATPPPPDFHMNRNPNLVSSDGRPPSRISSRSRASAVETPMNREVPQLIGDVFGKKVTPKARHSSLRKASGQGNSKSNERTRPSSAPTRRSLNALDTPRSSSRERNDNNSSNRKKMTGSITTAKKSEYHPRKKVGTPISAERKEAGRKRNSTSPAKQVVHVANPHDRQSPASSTPNSMKSVKNRSLTPISRRSKSGSKNQDTELQFHGPLQGTTEFFEQLSKAVLTATNNLAAVSSTLQEMASSLSESLQSHSKMLSSYHGDHSGLPSSALHVRATPSNLFSPTFALENHADSNVSSPERVPNSRSPTVSRRTLAAALREPTEQRNIPRVDSELSSISDDRKPGARSNQNAPSSPSKSADISGLNDTFQSTGVQDEELAELIRSALREKLTSMLSPK